jgi:hypothetical protein
VNFLRLFRKELRGSSAVAWPLVAGIVLLDALLRSRMGIWREGLPAAVSAAASLVVAAWPIGALLYSMQAEWATNSVQLLLSLPVRGATVCAAKLASVVAWSYVLAIARGLSFWLFFGRPDPRLSARVPISVAVNAGLQIAAVWTAFMVTVLVLAQCSFVVGRTVPRWWGLTAAAAFIVQGWLLVRLVPVMSRLFQWLPDLRVGTWSSSADVVILDTLTLDSGFLAALAVMLGGFLVLGGLLLEGEMEV